MLTFFQMFSNAFVHSNHWISRTFHCNSLYFDSPLNQLSYISSLPSSPLNLLSAESIKSMSCFHFHYRFIAGFFLVVHTSSSLSCLFLISLCLISSIHLSGSRKVVCFLVSQCLKHPWVSCFLMRELWLTSIICPSFTEILQKSFM